MITINRGAIVVWPAQAFLDWLRKADPTSEDLSLEDLRQEPTIYLLPECADREEARKYLGKVCRQIFEEEFESWYHLPSSWPKRLDMATFDRFFEWSFHSVVTDLSNREILREEL